MNNYCVLPFNSVSINAEGGIRQCCNAHGVVSKTYVGYDDTLNNKFIKEIRQAFINDKRHSACDRCWKMEDAGTRSFRQYANNDEDYGVRGKALLLKPEIKYHDIEYIDITLGNTCNLACRMCNPYSSSLVAKQMKELKLYSGPTDITLESAAKQKVIELFSNAINLKKVYLLGGEPLINEMHDEILDLLIDIGVAKNIVLHYNTNLQVNKLSTYLEKWNHFKKIDIQASIDGHGTVYEYIRWPGKWDKLYKNLFEIVSSTDPFKYNIGIAATIQNINAENMFDLLDACSIMDNKKVPFFFIPVTGNSTLDLTPKHILEKGIEKIQTLKKTLGPVDDLYGNYQRALATTPSAKQAKEFFRDMQMYDIKRGQNLFDTIPFMEEVANNFNIKTWH